jgi:EmrB/QacA subfamily drug resistance transporter
MFATLSHHHFRLLAERRSAETRATPAAPTPTGTVLALVALGLSVFVLAQDFSAVNVALPNIERDFDTGIGTVQWVINAYTLVFAMLIVAGGRLADQYGRRPMFFIGTVIFALMSLLAGAAPNVYWLIAARGLMGVGAALMWPATLGMTYAALPSDKAGLAGGLIIGACGVGQAVGPINGGLLTQFVGWRWIQFMNLPIAAFTILIVWLELHQPSARSPNQKLDFAGIITLSLALLGLLFALDQAPVWGWSDPRIIAILVLSAVLLVAFLFAERRAGANALVPASLIGNRRFAATCVAIALVVIPFFTALLYLPQFMQKLLAYSPLQAGLGMLPMMIGFALLSFVGGPLYQKLGPKLMVTAGAVCLAIGPLLLSFVTAQSGYSALVPGLIAIGIGMGLFFSSATTAGVESADPSETSLAGGLIYMFQIGGGSIGLGLTTMVITAVSLSRLTSSVASLGVHAGKAQVLALHGLLAGTETARQTLTAFAPDVVRRLPVLVSDAFVTGISAGYRVDAAIVLVAVVLAILFIGGPPKMKAPPDAAESERAS